MPKKFGGGASGILAGVLVCGVGLGLSGDATALVQWTLTSGGCIGTTGGSCGGEFADTRTFETSFNNEGGDPTVTASGWANTELSGNTTLGQGDIAQYGGGLGVRNADWNTDPGDPGENGSPEHAMDNDDRFDLILFDFGDDVISLSEITLGYFNTDADISVLAYTGDGDPLDTSDADDLLQQTYTSTSTTLANSADPDDPAFAWTIIGSYDVDSTDPTAPYTQPIDTIVASSYWIVSSFNPVIGNCLTSYCNHPSYTDHVKIKILAGNIIEPPIDPTGDPVPEPGTLMLMACAIPLIARRRWRLRTVL